MILLFGLLLLLIFILKKLYNNNKYWENMGIKQYPPLPLVGNFGQIILQRKSTVELFDQMYKHFPNERYFGMYQFLTPLLVIRDPDLIKKITVKDFDTFPEHATVVPEDVDPLFSRNILFIKGGPKWQRLRSLLSPAFTSYKLKMMYPLMVTCAKQLLDQYNDTDDIIILEMKDTFARYTNDVIGTTAFGIECNSFENPSNIFYKMGKDSISISIPIPKIFGYSLFPSLMKFLNIGFLPKHVCEFFTKTVIEAMRMREDQNLHRPDVINLLLDARKGRLKYEDAENEDDSSFAVVEESKFGKEQNFKFSDISDQDLIAQAVIFFLAGFDTSSTALTFAAYELAINPDVQKKLQDEIDDVVQKSQSDFISYDTLIHMNYLDMVMTESLRKWPPLTFNDRRSVKPFTIESETADDAPLHFEAGTICVIPTNAIHMDPQYFPNPNKFDPERFNESNKQSIKSYSYLPFGVGPKSCIGNRLALLETKLVLFAILSKFDIVPVSKTQIPVVIKKQGLFLAVEGGMWLGLKKRNFN